MKIRGSTHKWLQTSWTWAIGQRILGGMWRWFDRAVQQSVIVKALARSVEWVRSCSRQAMGCVIAGALCGFVGLAVFGSRALSLGDVAVRGVLCVLMIGALIRCAGSAGK